MTSVSLLEAPIFVGNTIHASLNGERYVEATLTNFIADSMEDVLLLGHHNDGRSGGLAPEWNYSNMGAGTIRRAFRAGSFSGFMIDAADPAVGASRDRAYWTVAKLNPAPVNGRYYRVLGIGDMQTRLLQYFDEGHVSDRFIGHNPWNVVYGGDSPWVYGLDSQNNVNNQTIVEVELDDSSSLLPQAAEWRLANRPTSVEPEVAVSAPPAAVTGPANALGLALIVDNTEPSHRPEIETGKIYVAWNRSSPQGQVDIITRSYGSRLGSIGTFTRNDDGEYVKLTTQNRNLWDDEYDWVRGVMPLVTTEPATDTARLAQLRSELTASEEAFDAFNSDLNTLAREHDWCSEYEDTVTPYGLKSRQATNKSWDLVIDAEVTITDDSPTSDLDRTLSNDWGISGFEATNIEVTGNMQITIARTAVDSDEAYENLDEDDVATAINEQYGVNVSINDFSLDSYEESD